MQRSRRRSRASGFTLVELLVVVAIVGILATLTLKVVGAMITNARFRATQATVNKLGSLLDQRLQAFNRTMTESWKRFAATECVKYPYARTTTIPYCDDDRNTYIKIMVAKDQFAAAFPQQLSETSLGVSSDATDNGTESIEALYHALVNANDLGLPVIGTDAFSATELADSDGDGRLEILDAWGHPLRFYRRPTRLIRPGGTGAVNTTAASLLIRNLPSTADLNVDPDDPLQLISSCVPNATAGPMGTPAVPCLVCPTSPYSTNSITLLTDFENNYHTPDTWSLPLIVSTGQDNLLGINEPSGSGVTASGKLADVTSITDLTDNITNLNIGVGGK